MSSQDYSQVATGPALTVPAQAGSGVFGPYVLYTLAAGEVSRVEAVTFVATIGGLLGEPVSFVMQLRDPNGNVLWQYLTPPFGEGV